MHTFIRQSLKLFVYRCNTCIDCSLFEGRRHRWPFMLRGPFLLRDLSDPEKCHTRLTPSRSTWFVGCEPAFASYHCAPATEC